MSYTLKYTGAEIDDILDRAVEGGTIDEALALKAPLESPALTGTPTAPTPAASDNSTKVATTAYADRAAAGAAAAAYPVDSASGAIASFPDGAEDIPMKSFVCSIEPIQAGSGDPSPDNIRAISGHAGVKAVRAGVNLFNKNTVSAGYRIGPSGQPYADADYSLSDWIIVRPNTTYIRTTTMTTNTAGAIYDANKNFIQRITNGKTISTTAATGYVRLSVPSTDIGTEQFEVGSTESTYEAYKGTTYPVDWTDEAGTVYGGTIDVVSGALTVDRASVDMGTLNWVKSGGANSRFAVNVPNCKPSGIVIADMFKPATYSQVYYHILDNAIASHNTYSQIAIHSTEYEADYDAEGFKAAMTGHIAVYELANPVTYQLTPTEVLSLLGQNNCYNDCGNTAVEYRADIALYVQKYLGGNVSTLSMSAPTPSLSLGRTGVLLEPEALEPVITEDAEPDLAEEEPEAVEEAEE